jgi:hypothetical protein
MRRSLLVTGFLTALLLDCPTGVLARGALLEVPAQTQVWAVLYGQPIPPIDVVNHHCHDLDAPIYRCFDTEKERDADAQVFIAAAASADLGDGGTLSLNALIQPLSVLDFTYALAYVDSNYGGASLMVSSPTPDLGVLGWNNVISSFKSTNGGRPKWWSGTNYGGLSYQWGTSAWVPYVGDVANDTFSSVKNVP